MKTKFLFSVLIFACFCLTGISQVPKGFNYQAIARDGSGTILANLSLPVKIDIQTSLTGGTLIYEESFPSVTSNSFGMITLVVGTGTQTGGTAASFSAINWNQTLFLKTIIQYPGTTWTTMGTSQIWSVPYALVADKANGVNTGTKLSVTSANDAGTDALFEVKRQDGQTVFAVYPTAVNVYVPKSTYKGVKGGFSVGGYDGSKAGSPGTVQDYLRVTPDSVRIYIDPNPTAAKGVKGGFAVGGYDESKGINSMYLNLSNFNAVSTVTSSSQVLWYPNKNAFLAGNIHIGHVDSVGVNSTALGYQSIAMGKYSQAFGYKTKALGDYSTAIGKNSVAGKRSPDRLTSLSSNAFALGNGTNATGDDSYAFGSGAQATGKKSFAFGSVSIDSSGNALSTKTLAQGDYSTAVGMGAQATSTGSMAFGTGATSGGYGSTALGFYSTSSGSYSVGIGYYAKATGIYSHSFGLKAQALGTGTLALGMYSYSLGIYSTALGYGSNAINQYSIALGFRAATTGDYSTALGRSAIASGLSSMALGYSATASGNTSFAVGYNASAVGDYSFAIGTYGLNSDGSVNTSRPTKTTLSYSLAMGMGAQSSQKGDIALGVNTTASGGYSTALGYGPSATGMYSTALGYNATGSGQYSSVLGYLATSSGNYSTAIGMSSLSAGVYSSAFGYGSQANGSKSLSVGTIYSYTWYTFSYNPITHRFILIPHTVTQNNIANGDYSLAFGNGNTSTDGGITVGCNNSATGTGATAIGHSNNANAQFSFAGGSYCTTVGNNSIAMGANVTAESANCFAIGAYNTLDGSATSWYPSDPLFVAGNGVSGTPHDALVIYKNGLTKINATDTVAGLWAYNYGTTWASTMYGTYSYAQQANTSSAASTYGAYLRGYSAGTGYTYGSYIYASNSTASTSAIYSTDSRSYNYGSGINYGIYSYAYNSSATTGALYSGYFTGYQYGSGTYYGLYADKITSPSIDLAEYIYDSNGTTQPADVVVADPDKKESVIKSTKAYQTSVVGVITTEPALIMGMELITDKKTGEPLKGVSATRLALSGRVPVNVCGENGDIKPGDYLTSSSLPGVAMKWTILDVNTAKDFDELKKILSENEKRRNAIIGKAVESFSGSGTGKIKVLISLQ